MAVDYGLAKTTIMGGWVLEELKIRLSLQLGFGLGLGKKKLLVVATYFLTAHTQHTRSA